jgi:hypothetical protein
MRPRYFIHAPSNPPDHACLDQTAQNHPDRTQVSDISEIRWSKCPTPPTLRHPDAPKDQIRGFSIGSISTHNVENMCLLFQHVNTSLKMDWEARRAVGRISNLSPTILVVDYFTHQIKTTRADSPSGLTKNNS